MKKRINENEVLNLDKLGDYEESYVLIPKALVNKNLTPCVVIVGSMINGYSGRQQSDGTLSYCNRTYEGFKKELGFSHGTIGKSLSSLSHAGYVVLGDKRSTYAFSRDKIAVNRYYRLDLRFIRQPLYIKNEGIRFLTPSEILVLAYFYTYCKNAKKSDKTKSASVQDIAWELDLSERTVWQALRTLLRASLIYRPSEDKGVNRHKVSRIHLDRRLQNLKRKKKETSDVSPALDKKAKEIHDLDAKAERERWYSVRRNKAEAKADAAQQKALSDAEYKRLTAELSTAEREAAKAEAFGLNTLPELEEKICRLKKKTKAALKRIGLKEIDFIPQYFCAACSDTGYLPTGKACNCYKKE